MQGSGNSGQAQADEFNEIFGSDCDKNGMQQEPQRQQTYKDDIWTKTMARK